jgi:hypothetical protein
MTIARAQRWSRTVIETIGWPFDVKPEWALGDQANEFGVRGLGLAEHLGTHAGRQLVDDMILHPLFQPVVRAIAVIDDTRLLSLTAKDDGFVVLPHALRKWHRRNLTEVLFKEFARRVAIGNVMRAHQGQDTVGPDDETTIGGGCALRS